MKKRQDTALSASEQKKGIFAQQLEKAKKIEEDNLLKYVMKTQKLEKSRKAHSKAVKEKLMTVERIDHKERLREINITKEE